MKVKLAIEALKHLPGTQFICCSSLYSSKPMGAYEQPDYVNAVAMINTLLEPLDLLDQTQRIELEFGRERKEARWDSRILDLDILLFGNLQIKSERLIVPHYGMKVRGFVLCPLAEIAPGLQLPDGSIITNLVAVIDKDELTVLV
ncbi:2-amino-4-hydroxy-6- hydroxymethyldihydropteridine pyrophosphokinase [Candidatus Enterovibrio altilux]|uniref:2-amino-4-hydroxy-6-hydroxymethyldihydropteridine pyrophosphokinase n=2 Tax=Candidatus Enterovibrio altilux TaxID=1927128 RepID=A0A291B8B4_9GAMM|nr:2-amino-4-hydroxy-6- hydroxymethyldihydropteridine pyrophosphokinase [Candidatus Enterovibrio luxaltus]